MPVTIPEIGKAGVAFGAALLLCTGALGALVVIWRRRRDPEAKERRRRADVNGHGRIAGAVVHDIDDGLIHYRYSIGAIEFSASQDVSTLMDRVGEDPKGIVGPATVKYHQKNPYNSIIVCEQWSGLRGNKPLRG